MPEKVRIQLFGGLHVICGDRRISQFETRKTTALLAFLALHPGRLHSRDELAERLWPDEDPEATRSRLRQALAALRRGLAEACHVLIVERGMVGLNTADCDVDIQSFEVRLREAASESNPESSARKLEAAASLYQGELLPGFFEDWAVVERERLKDAYAGALVRLARTRLTLGYLDSAHEAARLALRVDPLREEAHTERIRLLVVSGQRAEAARHYREYARLLREELDVPPSASLEELLDGLGPSLPEPAPQPAQPLANVVPSEMPHVDRRPHRVSGWRRAAPGVLLIVAIAAAAALWARSSYVGSPNLFRVASLCTEGRTFWNERTESGFRRAIENFEKALAIDPKFGPAHSGLADAYSLLGYYGHIAPSEVQQRGRDAARRAMEFSRNNNERAEALTSWGWIRMTCDWAWQDADEHFTEAIQLDPQYATAHQWRSLCLLIRKQFRMSIDEIRSALRSEPMSPVIAKSLGQRYYHAGQIENAIQHLEKALKDKEASGLTHYWLALAYAEAGQFAKAEGAFLQGLELSGENELMRSGLVYLYARWTGHEAKARSGLDTLMAQRREYESGKPRSYVSAYYIATVYAGLDEKDNAVTWLKKAHGERSCELPLLNVEPRLRPLRADPRYRPQFLQIVNDMGLN